MQLVFKDALANAFKRFGNYEVTFFPPFFRQILKAFTAHFGEVPMRPKMLGTSSGNPSTLHPGSEAGWGSGFA